MPTVAERAVALLGNREVMAHPHRDGVVVVAGTPHHRTGYTPRWEVDTKRTPWECNCPSWQMGTYAGPRHEQVAPSRTCKHVTLLQAILQAAQALKDAGALK